MHRRENAWRQGRGDELAALTADLERAAQEGLRYAVVNPGFDTDLSGWHPSNAAGLITTTWNALDAALSRSGLAPPGFSS